MSPGYPLGFSRTGYPLGRTGYPLGRTGFVPSTRPGYGSGRALGADWITAALNLVESGINTANVAVQSKSATKQSQATSLADMVRLQQEAKARTAEAAAQAQIAQAQYAAESERTKWLAVAGAVAVLGLAAAVALRGR